MVNPLLPPPSTSTSNSLQCALQFPYCINLNRRPERWVFVQSHYQRLQLPLIRFSAVDANDLPDDYLKKILTEQAYKTIYNTFRTDHAQLTIGAVGCYLSHVKLWELLASNQLERNKVCDAMFIIEDDATPPTSLNEVNEFLSLIPNDWDMVLLGGIITPRATIRSFKNRLIVKANRFYGLYAYIIRKKAAMALLPYVFPIREQLDSFLWKSGILKNVYAVVPSLVVHNGFFKTDIQTNCFECGSLWG